MDIKDIILIILVFVNIYFIYKLNFDNKSENFGTTTSPNINQLIASTYKVDLDAMRNLGQIAGNILIDDTLTLPATTTIANDLKINGNIIIDGNVTFTNRNTALLQIFPQYMVIPWATNNIIPTLWAPCDGYYYILNSDNYATRVPPNTPGSILTPDLRGRFVLGSGQGIDNNGNFLSARNLNDKGGEEKHTLLINEIPKHNHFLGGPIKLNGEDVDSYSNNLNLGRTGSNSGDAGGDANGNTTAHNNMPPFCVLNYIMKL